MKQERSIIRLSELIEVREKVAKETERYIKQFHTQISSDRLHMLQRHLQNTIDSIRSMRKDLYHLQHHPAMQMSIITEKGKISAV